MKTRNAILTAISLGALSWCSLHMYVTICAPAGITGFLTSLVTMDSTPCQALFTIISHSQLLYAGMIASLLYALFNTITSFMNGSDIPRTRPK
jgi:hypothetical protein